MQIIDITGMIEEGMWSYDPPITPPTIEKISSLDSAIGWEAHRLIFYTLTGTYLEVSAHLIPGGETIDQLMPRELICSASIFLLQRCGGGHAITVSELKDTGIQPKPKSAALIATGWDEMWNNPRFIVDSPYMTTEAMEWVISTGVSIIGADIPCFENRTRPEGVNRLLFSANCRILGPLVNLRRVKSSNLILVALPLKIRGVSGAPCRAIIIEL